MKRLNLLWLFAVVLIASCQKEVAVPSAEQSEIAKRTGVHSYSVTISTANEVNTMCNNLMLNVASDKSSKGTIDLYEYADVYHRVMIQKWEAANTNNIVINAGISKASERYFDATFRWGSTIIVGAATVELEPCK